MARGGAVSGPASPPRPTYAEEEWTCDGCGKQVVISLTPAALERLKYKHLCGGYVRPEPGREEA